MEGQGSEPYPSNPSRSHYRLQVTCLPVNNDAALPLATEDGFYTVTSRGLSSVLYGQKPVSRPGAGPGGSLASSHTVEFVLCVRWGVFVCNLPFFCVAGAPRTSQVTVGALVRDCCGPAPKALPTPRIITPRSLNMLTGEELTKDKKN